MELSVAANVQPTDLYQFVRGAAGKIWLPWYIWGGGTYATKYDYDSNKFFGYLGTVGVPFSGMNVQVKSLRLRGAAFGQEGATEGAFIRATLYEQSSNLAMPIATIVVDRRTVPSAAIGDLHFDIVQSAGDYVVSASTHALAIELFGEGQGIATAYGFCVDLEY
jgi:hypothetical protein